MFFVVYAKAFNLHQLVSLTHWFSKNHDDGNIYILVIASFIILLIFYVDDLLIIGNNHTLL
jgi:hypothetical protein